MLTRSRSEAPACARMIPLVCPGLAQSRQITEKTAKAIQSVHALLAQMPARSISISVI